MGSSVGVLGQVWGNCVGRFPQAGWWVPSVLKWGCVTRDARTDPELCGPCAAQIRRVVRPRDYGRGPPAGLNSRIDSAE